MRLEHCFSCIHFTNQDISTPFYWQEFTCQADMAQLLVCASKDVLVKRAIELQLDLIIRLSEDKLWYPNPHTLKYFVNILVVILEISLEQCFSLDFTNQDQRLFTGKSVIAFIKQRWPNFWFAYSSLFSFCNILIVVLGEWYTLRCWVIKKIPVLYYSFIV